jgi:hypothetical protein
MFAIIISSSTTTTTTEGETTEEHDIITSIHEMARCIYYACHICRHNADFIAPRRLTPICADCKARYVGIFGYEAFEIIREKREKI